jgi:hypothetical protein
MTVFRDVGRFADPRQAQMWTTTINSELRTVLVVSYSVLNQVARPCDTVIPIEVVASVHIQHDGGMEIKNGVQFDDSGAFDRWLAEHGAVERELWAIIFKKSSKKQTVTFDELLELALTRGWVDAQTKGVDDKRYGIRFVPRKPGSNWSATNRGIVKRLLEERRMHPAGEALLPADLFDEK